MKKTKVVVHESLSNCPIDLNSQIDHPLTQHSCFHFSNGDFSLNDEHVHSKNNSQMKESEESTSLNEELRTFLLGTELANNGSWSGSYLNKSSQELGLKSSMLVHNGDKFTKGELITIMESLFEPAHDHHQVIPLGDEGLKEWFHENLITQLQSKLIRNFLLKRSEKLHSKFLFQLILRFMDFERLVCKKTQKQPADLTRDDFLNPSLYDEVMTSQFFHQNFSLFYQEMNPFNQMSLSYSTSVPKFELPQAVSSFLAYKQRKGMKQERSRKYKYELHRFLKWANHTLTEFESYSIEEIPFSLFTQEHLKSYKNFLIKGIKSGRFTEGASMSHLKNIKTFFGTLYHMEFIKNDITRGIRNIQGDDYKSRYIPSEQEIEEFFTVIEIYSDAPKMDKLAFGFMLYLGFRSCELAKLRWENINWSLSDVKFIAKGGKVHSLPLPSQLVELINDMEKKEMGLVFGVEPKSLVQILSLKYRIFTLVAGWTESSGPHQLRHSFVTRLTQQNVPPKMLKRLARHVSLTTTSKYIHIKEEEIFQKTMHLSLPWEVDYNAPSKR